MKRTRSDAAATNDWSFSLRANPTRWHSRENDFFDSDEECASLSAQEEDSHSTQRLLRDLDLSSREDHAIFKPNPWSIARINAPSSSSCVPSVKQTSGLRTPAIGPSHAQTQVSKEQEALKRISQRQSAHPAPKHGSNIKPAMLKHVITNQEPTQYARSRAPIHNLSHSGRDILHGALKTPQLSNAHLGSHRSYPRNHAETPAGAPSTSLSSVNTNHSPQTNDSQTLITAHILTKNQTQLRSQASAKLLTPSSSTNPSRHVSSTTLPSSSATSPEAPLSRHIISELHPQRGSFPAGECMAQTRSNTGFSDVGQCGLLSEKSPRDTPHKLLHTQPYLCSTISSYMFPQPLSHSSPLTDGLELLSPNKSRLGSNAPHQDRPVSEEISDDLGHDDPMVTPFEEYTRVLVPRASGDMPNWLAATLPPRGVSTPPSRAGHLIDGTRSSGCRSSGITITTFETSRGSKRRHLSQDPSCPASPSSPLLSPSPSSPHPYISFAAPLRPTLDLDAEGDDPDASWSTLPGKAKKKDNDTRNKPIRRSGPFCLPGLSTSSKFRAEVSLATEKHTIHNHKAEPTLHEDNAVKRTRVITYLPPPPPPPEVRPPSSSAAGGERRWVQKKSGGEYGMIASSDDRYPDVSDEDMPRQFTVASARFKRPLAHDAYEPSSSEGARGSSPSPLPVDANIQIDEYAVGEQYPYTMKLMRQ